MNPWLARKKSQSPTLRDLERIEIDAAASELVMEYGELILGDAIKFSLNRSDAEDAYQRSLEILLTKAPTTDREQLVPWLRVVVRREATEIARSRHNRNLRLDETIYPVSVALEDLPDDEFEEKHELERNADALRRLSRDQLVCLVAQSEGLTYDEICERTGFTYRKVTRCLQDGKRNFSRRIDAIASGSECERAQPLIQKLFESDTDAAIELRPHLRHCIACREQVRNYQAAPRRVAALFPPTILVSGMHPGGGSVAGKVLASCANAFHRQVARWKAMHTVEKALAATALTAVAIGGGLAVFGSSKEHPGTGHPRGDRGPDGIRVIPLGRIVGEADAKASRTRGTSKTRRRKASGTAGGREASGSGASTPSVEKVTATPAGRQQPAAPVDSAAPVDDGSTEFLPENR